MGLEWSRPTSSKNGTIIIEAEFPSNKTHKDYLWKLWKDHKSEIKNDGFVTRKRNGRFIIIYYAKATENSHNYIQIGNTLKKQFLVDFETKFNKWQEIYKDMHSMTVLVEEGLHMMPKISGDYDVEEMDYNIEDIDNI